MSSRIRSVLLACAIIGVLPAPVQIAAQEPDPDAALKQRVVAFWDAMQKEDYATATELMHPESRDAFQHRIPKSRVNAFRLEKIYCNAEHTACEATVMVRKPVAIMNAQEVEWPLRSNWVLEQGTWYFKLTPEESRNVLLEMFHAQQEAPVPQAKPAQAAPPKPPDPDSIRVFRPDGSNPQRVHRGEKAVFKFNFTNETSQPVRIVSVESDCHCTDVAATHPEIAPGQAGQIQATLDTFGLPLGKIEKMIRVTFADLADPVGIRLVAINEPNFEVAPAQVEFGTVPVDQLAEKTLRIVNRSGRPVRLVQVNSSTRLLLSPSEAELAPGEDVSIALRYSPAASGDFVESLMLKTDLAAEPLISVIVHGKAGS